MRRAIVLLWALGSVLLTAGCTVPINALAGVGVDAQGNLVGYLHVCHDQIDGATLYYDADSGSAQAVDAGSWKATAPITGTATWTLPAPSAGWNTLAPLQKLTHERGYTLYGWTNDNSWSAASVTFTLREATELQPGQVLYFSARSGGRPERDLNEVGTIADFQRRACEP